MLLNHSQPQIVGHVQDRIIAIVVKRQAGSGTLVPDQHEDQMRPAGDRNGEHQRLRTGQEPVWGDAGGAGRKEGCTRLGTQGDSKADVAGLVIQMELRCCHRLRSASVSRPLQTASSMA